MVKIRKASVDDAKYIAELGRVTFGETFGCDFRDPQDLLDYYEKIFAVEKIRCGIKKLNNIFWIAEINGLAAGYGKLKLNSASSFSRNHKEVQLQKIYVLKDYLSMGIGAKIYSEMLKAAQQHDMENIWLSVLQKNQRAVSFYERLGFKERGVHDYIIGKEKFSFYELSKDLK